MESAHCRKVAVNERARGYCTCNRNSMRKGGVQGGLTEG